MTLSMACCIGKADCTRAPSAGRGLCSACYDRHRINGTLKHFPTMRERTAQLLASGQINPPKTPAQYTKAWRDRKYAERVRVSGVLVHPRASHGRLHVYNTYGCRGAMCRASHLYYNHTGLTALPDDIRGGAQPTTLECVEFDIATFRGAYL